METAVVGRRRAAAHAVAVRAVAVLAVAALLVGLLPAPADAFEVRTRNTQRLLDDLSHQRLEIVYADGRVARGNVLRFRETGSTVELRPRLARRTVVGLQTTASMASAELPRGAVAGTNGGYWVNRPAGAPNGLYVERGRLIAGDSVNRSGNGVGRGTVGIAAGGGLVMDRLRVALYVDSPDLGLPPIEIDEINRQVRTSDDGTLARSGELLLFDGRYGTSFRVPAGSVLLVVEELELGSSGRVEGAIVDRRAPTSDTTFSVPEGRTVLLAYGDRTPVLETLGPGLRVGVTVEVSPFVGSASRWHDLVGAIPGGPLLIRDGRRLSVNDWRTETFSESHLTSRNPRTAIARTGDGRILLVTIDGRRTGWSVGATLRELSEVLLELGAVDAVNLDGGGSTTMTVNASIVNRPSESGRSVANALFLYAPLPPENRGTALACPPPVPDAGFADTRGTTHEKPIDCLAWWGVTTGVTATSFAPDRAVSREQMASFLARWIDDVAARGGGNALPSSASLRFDDVASGSAHADAIARLSEAGVITGRTSTTFEPGASVTRAQTASLLLGAIEYVTGSGLPEGRDTFIDDTGSVHEDSIDRLAGVGIITGVGGFAYRPEAAVTRGAMSSLVMRGSDLVVERGLVAPPG